MIFLSPPLPKRLFLLLLGFIFFLTSCKKEIVNAPLPLYISVTNLTDIAYWRMPFASSREKSIALSVNFRQDTAYGQRLKRVQLKLLNPHTGFDVSLSTSTGTENFTTNLKLLYNDASSGSYPVQVQVLVDTQVLQTLSFNCIIRRDTSCYAFFNNKTYRCTSNFTGNQVFEVTSRRPFAAGKELLLSGLPGMSGEVQIFTSCEGKTVGTDNTNAVGNIWLVGENIYQEAEDKLAQVRLSFGIQTYKPNGTPAKQYSYTLYLNE